MITKWDKKNEIPYQDDSDKNKRMVSLPTITNSYYTWTNEQSIVQQSLRNVISIKINRCFVKSS